MSEQSPEQKRNLHPIVIVGIILAVLCGISLYIRIALPYDQIFVNDGVWFRETDAYYYMRNIETLVHNFPHFNSFDPYMLFPGGAGVLARPFFAWLVAGIIRLVSWGVPTLHTMEAVAAYMPAILGTLTLIPVYFIGKELFNRWVGVISAALIVILPGELLHRSLLGFTDHHVAEVLFSTVCILFLIMAIKRAREREISFGHLLSRDWSTITKPLVYILLAGVFLGIYLLTWQGGLLLIFIIFAYLVIQFIVDHLRHKSSDYLCIVGTPLFLVAFLMLLPVLGKSGLDTVYRVALPVAIVLPIVLSIISRLMAGRALKPVYYPLTLLGLVGIGLAVLHAINPSLFQYMLGQFSIFAPGGAMLTVLEVQPLLFPGGEFTLRIAWANFTTSFFISFISFAMLIYVAIKEKSADKILFLVWSIIMLMAVLGQRRFGYYYAVSAALLTGYFSWKMLDIAGLGKLLAKSKEVVGAVKKFKKKQKKTREKAKPKTFMQPRGAWVRVIVVGIVIFFVVFFWSIVPTKYDTASETWSFGFAEARTESQVSGLALSLSKMPNAIMNEGWYTSCLWLKDNSPEPFDNPDFYYELYPPRDEFEYPETAYGVMSWWDYGYFIMQISHRIPNANPGQAGAVQAGQFFTAQDESSANEIANDRGSKYVMIDHAMATPAKFYAMAEWAGSNVSEFYEIYYLPEQDGGQLRYLFYPAYYQSTVVRLYNFDGKAVVPTAESIVISYEGEVTAGEKKYKIITSGQYFSSYEEAQAYVASQTSGNYKIVGDKPFSSIVPLEELNSYERVYPDPEVTTTTTTVKIFKYLGSSES
ncbi:MAG TPA: oligosaccharyl transferase, archaeosortase A system-associated [Dehalococcoidia bacterium]|nr:oligosaccharyl transferase, archaeosortase A system-associated [Dehalococcoidia bacterium]